MRNNTFSDQEIELQRKKKFKIKPKISIVCPLYNTDTEFFRELLYSIHCQTYSNWELCLADGSENEQVEIKEMIKNGTIDDGKTIALVLHIEMAGIDE